jgi:hypothetical protein
MGLSLRTLTENNPTSLFLLLIFMYSYNVNTTSAYSPVNNSVNYSSAARVADAERSGTENIGSPPPRYKEIYKDDGDFFTPGGKHKLLADPRGRDAFMKKHRLNQKLITSKEVAIIKHKTPVLIIDTSGSMTEKVKKGAVGVSGKIKNVFTPRETRLREQEREGIELVQMLEAFCAQKPSMYNLKGNYLDDVSSASPTTKHFYKDAGGGTPLSATLDTVKAHLSRTHDTHDIALYISTDGDPTDGGRDLNECRLAFETRLRDLVDSGVTVRKPDGTSHTRTVGISMQYVGDDDDEFQYTTAYDKSTPENAARTAKNRLDEVRRYGSAGAYYSALDNERMGGIQRFDVNDDPASEINDAARNGHKISRKGVTLKKMVGMYCPRLDRMDESMPAVATRSSAYRVQQMHNLQLDQGRFR